MTEQIIPKTTTDKQIEPLVIDAGKFPLRQLIDEIWDYRELFIFFTLRKVKARYKQTVLGASWAIIRPVITMIVFSVFFGDLAQVPSDGVPYPIFSYTALVPWTFFSSGIAMAANSLINSTSLVTKVYFPRVIFPTSEVLATAIDTLIASVVLFGMMIYYQIELTVNIIWVIPLYIIAALSAMGVGFLLSALNVQSRDIRHAVPFLVQVLMYLTPVAYPSSLIENPTLRAIYSLNPMVGVVEGFRWALLGVETNVGSTILISAIASVVIFIIGLLYFQSVEESFADVI